LFQSSLCRVSNLIEGQAQCGHRKSRTVLSAERHCANGSGDERLVNLTGLIRGLSFDLLAHALATGICCWTAIRRKSSLNDAVQAHLEHDNHMRSLAGYACLSHANTDLCCITFYCFHGT